MFKGLYAAASGMAVGLRRTDVIANNLANSSTPGFKRELLSAGSYLGLDLCRIDRASAVPPMLPLAVGTTPLHGTTQIGGLGTGVVSAEAGLDPRTGVVEATGHPSDLAIDGPGWFQVLQNGVTAYTRRGDVRVDRAGFLVNGAGGVLLGENGPIRATETGQLVVAEDGLIGIVTADGHRPLDRLVVVEFANVAGLERGPDGTMFAGMGSGPPLAAVSSRVQQGCLESSNACPVTEMVEMIAAYRAYEAMQRAVQALDSAMSRANDVGRVN